MTAQVLHEYLFIRRRHSKCYLNPTYCPFKLYKDVIFQRHLMQTSEQIFFFVFVQKF